MLKQFYESTDTRNKIIVINLHFTMVIHFIFLVNDKFFFFKIF